MYKEAYQEENKVEVSVTQLVATAVIIMVALVLPAQYITSMQQGSQVTPYTAEALRQRDQQTTTTQPATNTEANTLASGRVAGASSDGTASDNTILGFRAETGILVLGGILLIVVAASTGMYLMFTAPPKQKLPASWH